MTTRKLLGMALAAGLAAPAMAMAEVAIQRPADFEGSPTVSRWGRKGKGKGKRPNHSSSRFVAMDKREARRARNRR